MAFYARKLTVPERRETNSPEVLRGKRVLHDVGCVACHTPAHVAHRLEGQQSFQLIWPYTDPLLHDMGHDLADGMPGARAEGREWHTPPLWGIDLTAVVGGEETYLHYGRARSRLEAVLWLGGEAGAGRDRVVALPPADRAALVRFLGRQ